MDGCGLGKTCETAIYSPQTHSAAALNANEMIDIEFGIGIGFGFVFVFKLSLIVFSHFNVTIFGCGRRRYRAEFSQPI